MITKLHKIKIINFRFLIQFQILFKYNKNLVVFALESKNSIFKTSKLLLVQDQNKTCKRFTVIKIHLIIDNNANNTGL